MAPVIKALEAMPGDIRSRVCVTAQHRQMLDQVLDLFGIRPDHDLDLMREDQDLAELTAALFTGLSRVLETERPDWVLIQGDTTSVMVAAMAAFYRKIKVGHVEAGLRTGNRFSPFPEEINRRVATLVTDLHFAPTRLSRENLLAEGVDPETVLVTGNPVIDALHLVADMEYDFSSGLLAGLPFDKRIILVTAHRRESFGAPLENICAALAEIAQNYRDDVHIVYPVHLNPHVREPVNRMLGDIPNVTLTRPLDYLPLVKLMQASYLVLTDSGGIQEEAPGLGKPVLVMRETTERPEGIEAGTIRLVGTSREKIVAETTRLLDDPGAYAEMARAANPYGDGHAAPRIARAVLEHSLKTPAGEP